MFRWRSHPLHNNPDDPRHEMTQKIATGAKNTTPTNSHPYPHLRWCQAIHLRHSLVCLASNVVLPYSKRAWWRVSSKCNVHRQADCRRALVADMASVPLLQSPAKQPCPSVTSSPPTTYDMFESRLAPLQTHHIFWKPLLWASARQMSPSPHPPLVLQHLCRNWGPLFVQRQISTNNSYVGATKSSQSCLCVLFFLARLAFWAKERSGQRHLYHFQRDAEQSCTPLDRSWWRWPHLKKGKEPHW